MYNNNRGIYMMLEYKESKLGNMEGSVSQVNTNSIGCASNQKTFKGSSLMEYLQTNPGWICNSDIEKLNNFTRSRDLKDCLNNHLMKDYKTLVKDSKAGVWGLIAATSDDNVSSHKKLSTWYLKNCRGLKNFETSKLQYFIFLYEAFSKQKKGEADFSSFKVYKSGPIFADIYNSLIYDLEGFISEIARISDLECISKDIAKVAMRITSMLSESDLFSLVKYLDFWAEMESRFAESYLEIDMESLELTVGDLNLINELWSMYADDYYDDLEVIKIRNTYYVIKKNEVGSLNSEHRKILLRLADNNIPNPVYVNINEEGVLEID